MWVRSPAVRFGSSTRAGGGRSRVTRDTVFVPVSRLQAAKPIPTTWRLAVAFQLSDPGVGEATVQRPEIITLDDCTLAESFTPLTELDSIRRISPRLSCNEHAHNSGVPVSAQRVFGQRRPQYPLCCMCKSTRCNSPSRSRAPLPLEPEPRLRDHVRRCHSDRRPPRVIQTRTETPSSHVCSDYKVQGWTLSKLVLSIGERPFEPHLSMTSLYVLASRARLQEHGLACTPLEREDGRPSPSSIAALARASSLARRVRL
jgi:hypothetical protein